MEARAITTAARNAEADEVEKAFQVALASIGAATVKDALELWESMPPTARASAASSWLTRAVRLVMGRRGASRDLGIAYYRLVRALRTGTTIPDPRDPEPSFVSLDQLRDEFVGLAGVPSEAPSEPAPTETPDPPQEGGTEAPSPAEEDDTEDDRILIEELEALDREQEELDRLAEEEARIALEALGAENQRRKVEEIDNEQKAKDADKARDAAHDEAGARQAAAAARVAMDGARSAIWDTASRDKRALGYVRLSRTGTPCGWCAMLISRGPVYRSEGSASFKGGAATYDDGDKYHDNCNCYAMPIFTREQFNDSDLYALNREYGEAWPRVTRGLSGKAAVSAWRRYIRSQKSTRAQAAAATTSPGGS